MKRFLMLLLITGCGDYSNPDVDAIFDTQGRFEEVIHVNGESLLADYENDTLFELDVFGDVVEEHRDLTYDAIYDRMCLAVGCGGYAQRECICRTGNSHEGCSGQPIWSCGRSTCSNGVNDEKCVTR